MTTFNIYLLSLRFALRNFLIWNLGRDSLYLGQFKRMCLTVA